MTKIILILFTLLTTFSLYSIYTGIGLEELKYETKEKHSTRMGSSHSYSNGGWGYGK